MKQPRESTMCRRCERPYGLHAGKGPEGTRLCPWRDDGSTFRRSIQHLGASQSFTEREIAVLDQVTRKLLQGGDMQSLAQRHTETLEKLARKAAGMRRTAAARKATS
jgi:hypothetical protein